MKKTFACCLLLFCLCTPLLHAQETLTTKGFEQKMNTPGIQLLDVRTPAEYKNGHLKNALQADWLNKAQFTDRLQYMDQSKPVLVYCASGIRSAEAAQWMREKGFTNIQHLQGGINAWKREGREVISATAVKTLRLEDYNKAIASAATVLVEFGAPWCPPCKQMEGILSQLEKEAHGKIKLARFNVDESAEVMNAQHVSDAIPVLILYKNQKEVWRKSGIATLPELKALLR